MNNPERFGALVDHFNTLRAKNPSLEMDPQWLAMHALLALGYMDENGTDTPKANLPGAERILTERVRQITDENWTPKHDDEHERNEMAWAAVCYAAPAPVFELMHTVTGYAFRDPWRWSERFDKRRHIGGFKSNYPRYDVPLDHDQRIDFLTKAGALLAAEIDRLERLKARLVPV